MTRTPRVSDGEIWQRDSPHTPEVHLPQALVEFLPVTRSMRIAALCSAPILVTLMLMTTSRAIASVQTEEPPFDVEEAAAVLTDPDRDREVPLRVYAPKGARAPLPVVLFSHGIGESRDAYVYLGRHFASQGYVAIHLTHYGTDRSVLEKDGLAGIYRAIRNPENWRNRPRDVSFVLDVLERGSPVIPLASGLVDMGRVAVAGHSAGAFTALALAGLRVPEGTTRDPRVKVAIAMSMPRIPQLIRAENLRDIAIPVLHITGTRDRSLLYWTFPRDRRVAFDLTTAPDQYLVTLEGVGHWTFSNPDRPERKREHRQHQAIAEISTAFLDERLSTRKAAGGLEDVAGRWGERVEKKIKN